MTVVRRLSNGMRLVVDDAPGTSTVAMAVCWPAGFSDDPDDRPGLAHLVEHLMFQGTDRHDRVDYYRTYIGCGGETNAYTRTAHSTYYAEFPHQILPEVLRLEADRFGNFRPSARAIRAEAATISHEVGETTSARPLNGFPWEHVQAALFDDRAHAHNGYVVGSALARTPPRECVRWVERCYRPELATVALVGPFGPDGTAALVDETLGQVTRSAPARHRPRPVPADRRAAATVPSNGRHATAFGWLLPEHLTATDRAAHTALAHLLGQVRLPRALQAAGVHGIVKADFGMFGDLAELPEGAYLTVQAYHGPNDRAPVGRAVAATVDDLATGGPTAAEVADARDRQARADRRLMIDPLRRARRLAEHVTLWQGRLPAGASGIGPDDVRTAARGLVAPVEVGTAATAVPA